MTKSYARVVRPVLHRIDPAVPDDTGDQLRRAWQQCERQIDAVIAQARIAA